MNLEEERSLHQKITDEIERNYRTIDIVGKHYTSILIAAISLVGIIGIGISEMNNFFSDWIVGTNIFFAVIILYTCLKGCVSLKEETLGDMVFESLSEKQKIIYSYLLLDAAVMYLDSVFRGLGVILLTNLFIIILFVADLVQGNYTILQNDISLIFFAVPAWIWFIFQAFSFFIITWFVTSDGIVMRLAIHEGISRLIPKMDLEELKNRENSLFNRIFFGVSIIFFSFTIVVTVFNYWGQISNWPFIVAIILIQFVIFELLNNFFSANNLVRDCFLKIYQLNVAQTIEENIHNFNNLEVLASADDIYHNSRLFIPIKIDKFLFLANYLFIPNIAYMINEEHQELLIEYLKSKF